VDDGSWLKNKDNFKGKEEKGYGTLDIANAPEVSEEEYDKMAEEERSLRQQLRTVDIFQKSAPEVAQLMKEKGLDSILQEWLNVHMRNKAIYMKKGEGDVLLVPTTQVLIEAAKLLQH
jgi:prophage DNA circulation protein